MTRALLIAIVAALATGFFTALFTYRYQRKTTRLQLQLEGYRASLQTYTGIASAGWALLMARAMLMAAQKRQPGNRSASLHAEEEVRRTERAMDGPMKAAHELIPVVRSFKTATQRHWGMVVSHMHDVRFLEDLLQIHQSLYKASEERALFIDAALEEMGLFYPGPDVESSDSPEKVRAEAKQLLDEILRDEQRH